MLDKNDLSRSDYDRQVFDRLPRPRWLDAAAGPKVLDPDPTYIAPSLFSHGLQVNQSIREVLPSQDFADRIMEHYWVSTFRGDCFLVSTNTGVERPCFESWILLLCLNLSCEVRSYLKKLH